MWELDYKESWALKIWCFWTVVFERLLRVPWTTRRSHQSILKEISREYSLEGLMLKVKVQLGPSLELQFSSVAQSHLTLCDPMDCSTPGLPVHHQLPEFTQTHVHLVNDTIQPFHPLSSPSPPPFNLSQHQGLFKRVSSSHQVAKVLSFRFSISPSNEYSRLISFRIDWFDTLLNYLFVFHLFGN